MMERAILVTVNLGKRGEWPAPDKAAELKELAVSSGVRVAAELIVNMKAPHSAYFIGSGKAAEIAARCSAEGAAVVIFNNDLSGTQQKNLEKALGVKTIDRTQLILDIFARRARSNEGKLQVELAQLLYLMPRLIGKGIELSRLGGGIGTRGPGEQKLEMDRRRIKTRIDHLRAGLDDLSRRRAMMRTNRGQFALLSAALVGYTNVGKSTLLNALTDSDVIVADKLFATLDPTARTFALPNRQKILLVDTVGFLNDLPHHLIEAFKATLEEVSQADLLLHVVDASHPKVREQSDAVYRVLEEIGAKDKPVITVVNKIDKLENAQAVERIKGYCNDPVAVSALRREGFDALVRRLQAHAAVFMTTASFSFPAGDARLLSIIHDHGLVLKQEYRGDRVYVEAELPVRVKEAIERLCAERR